MPCQKGTTMNLPPVLLGAIPAVRDPSKRTVAVYGHLDVQPAKKVPC
jgi:acetylornithine deacetylase/succinyl-diaminopimelate desuccinylase-like protein